MSDDQLGTKDIAEEVKTKYVFCVFYFVIAVFISVENRASFHCFTTK